MKKVLMILFVACTIGVSLGSAQKMTKGTSLVNVGLGVVPGVGVNVSYDYGLVDTWGPGIFTIGGFIGYQNWGDSYYYRNVGSDYRVNEFAFAPRATYRYAINNSFEVYGAVAMGFRIESYSKYLDNETDFYMSTTAGCRYTFTKNISVFAEVGWNLAYLNGGISFAF